MSENNIMYKGRVMKKLSAVLVLLLLVFMMACSKSSEGVKEQVTQPETQPVKGIFKTEEVAIFNEFLKSGLSIEGFSFKLLDSKVDVNNLEVTYKVTDNVTKEVTTEKYKITIEKSWYLINQEVTYANKTIEKFIVDRSRSIKNLFGKSNDTISSEDIKTIDDQISMYPEMKSSIDIWKKNSILSPNSRMVVYQRTLKDIGQIKQDSAFTTYIEKVDGMYYAYFSNGFTVMSNKLINVLANENFYPVRFYTTKEISELKAGFELIKPDTGDYTVVVNPIEAYITYDTEVNNTKIVVKNEVIKGNKVYLMRGYKGDKLAGYDLSTELGRLFEYPKEALSVEDSGLIDKFFNSIKFNAAITASNKKELNGSDITKQYLMFFIKTPYKGYTTNDYFTVWVEKVDGVYVAFNEGGIMATSIVGMKDLLESNDLNPLPADLRETIAPKGVLSVNKSLSAEKASFKSYKK